MQKEGQRESTEPAPPQSLLDLLATLEPIAEDFPEINEPVPDPVGL